MFRHDESTVNTESSRCVLEEYVGGVVGRGGGRLLLLLLLLHMGMPIRFAVKKQANFGSVVSNLYHARCKQCTIGPKQCSCAGLCA